MYTNNETNQVKSVQQHNKEQKWIGAWTASQLMPYDFGISQIGFKNQTVRMIVHPHASGSKIRFRFSNIFGTKPLTLGKVNVALASNRAKTISGSERQVTFGGKLSITIPVGEEVFSDPTSFDFKEGENLTVSVFVPNSTGPTTWHRFGMQTTYFSTEGDYTTDHNASSFTKSVESWFWLSGIDILSKDKNARVIVALGDSISDGYNSELDANHRYPDYLAERLKDNFKQEFSVLNAGISGNRILQDDPLLGIKALDRIDRDVFSQTGVTDVILLEGINDIRLLPHNYNTEQIIAGIKKIVDKVHTKGLRIYGGTLSPYRGTPDYTEEGEVTRIRVNTWIRSSGVFDGVIDFEKALADPNNPSKMLPAYDSGDHVHPNDAGYKAMAEVIDLSIFNLGR
ncbi:hypothetical protein B1R38_05215 [Bacillus cereus]|uniref:SGNH/GDSL hydrolase family protein n=1 Tax=Bacillus cereus TaxID=1396 RepID=UPI000D671CEB|nr:SGNH/GDSL hydrolase family protein [Bacillus cereus]PWE74528.1 hypothetical protein B1R38_05215 [Bacillus cereus]